MGIVTKCKDCIFAVYDCGTQIDCLQNRIEKYRKKGKLNTEEFGNKKSYYISGACMKFRNKEWLNEVDKGKETVYKVLKKELFPKASLIIYSNLLEPLLKTLDSSKGYNEIIIITDEESILVNNNTVKELSKRGIKYKIISMKDPSLDIREKIDHAVEKMDKKNEYYTIGEAGKELNDNLETLYNKIHESELWPLLCIEQRGEEWHNLTINRIAHKLMFGNKGDFIKNKIKQASIEQNKVYWMEWFNLTGEDK